MTTLIQRISQYSIRRMVAIPFLVLALGFHRVGELIGGTENPFLQEI